jgi:hypothetical protein
LISGTLLRQKRETLGMLLVSSWMHMSNRSLGSLKTLSSFGILESFWRHRAETLGYPTKYLNTKMIWHTTFTEYLLHASTVSHTKNTVVCQSGGFKL